MLRNRVECVDGNGLLDKIYYKPSQILRRSNTIKEEVNVDEEISEIDSDAFGSDHQQNSNVNSPINDLSDQKMEESGIRTLMMMKRNSGNNSSTAHSTNSVSSHQNT